MYNPYGESINPGFKKPRYSKMEIRDLIASVLVLSVAFTIILMRKNPHTLDVVLTLFVISLILVFFSFVLHELAHKFVAQKYGAWAEYRMFPIWLGIALIMSFVGFLFAAPGAVYIQGRIDDKMNGKISAAGPAVNIVLAVVGLLLAIMTTGLVSNVCWMLVSINAFLALFNLIPIMPFDGSKIYKWNLPLYIGMIAISAVLLAKAWGLF